MVDKHCRYFQGSSVSNSRGAWIETETTAQAQSGISLRVDGTNVRSMDSQSDQCPPKDWDGFSERRTFQIRGYSFLVVSSGDLH